MVKAQFRQALYKVRRVQTWTPLMSCSTCLLGRRCGVSRSGHTSFHTAPAKQAMWPPLLCG